MNKFLGYLWVFIGMLYFFDKLEPTQFGTVMMAILLALYSFNDKK